MLEWWEAAILSLVGVLVGSGIAILNSYLGSRWSSGQEVRRAARDLRRERMQPVSEFIQLAKQMQAGDVMRRGAEQLTDEQQANLKEMMEKHFGESPNLLDLSHYGLVAFATAPTREMRERLVVAFTLVSELARDESKSDHDAFNAVRAAEESLVSYIVGS